MLSCTAAAPSTTFDDQGASYTHFQSINDSGTITGVAGIGGTTVCFVIPVIVFTPINTSAYPAYFCNSVTINNSGQIVLTRELELRGLPHYWGL